MRIWAAAWPLAVLLFCDAWPKAVGTMARPQPVQTVSPSTPVTTTTTTQSGKEAKAKATVRFVQKS